MREVAILKTVGASRSALARMFCTEFAIVGAAAGLIGGVLAGIASSVLIRRLLETPYTFSWIPVIAAGAITTLLTVLTGWLACVGILDRKPLDILRQIES
jgi:putative ABC transport system permease protein